MSIIVSLYNEIFSDAFKLLFAHECLYESFQFDLVIQEISQGRSYNKVNANLKLVSLNSKSPLIKQVSEVLTPFAFKKFQEEFERAALYTVNQVGRNEFMVKYFEGDSARQHKVFWDGHNMSCSCKNFEFWGIICRHSLRVFVHRDCFNIPPFYLPLRWHCDALEANNNVQERENDMLPEEECTPINNGFEEEIVVLCPPPSKRKGRPKNKREKGGKELGLKKSKCCSLCKQPGHTKPTCPHKENIFTLNDVDEGTSSISYQKDLSSTSMKKQKRIMEELGLNPVFTLKI